MFPNPFQCGLYGPNGWVRSTKRFCDNVAKICWRDGSVALAAVAAVATPYVATAASAIAHETHFMGSSYQEARSDTSRKAWLTASADFRTCSCHRSNAFSRLWL